MSEIFRLRVTPLLCAVALLAWIVQGPLLTASGLNTLYDSFGAVVRHGSGLHLVMNLGFIAIAGAKTEWQIGATKTAFLVTACTFFGTVMQFTFSGPGFAGMSAAGYGLLGFALISEAPEEKLVQTWCILAIVLLAETMFQSETLSIYTHITSILIGGGYAMFGSLFGSKDPVLKPMEMTHLSPVIAIINETDEDDALEAERSLLDEGLDGMFVLFHKGQVLGVTGFGLDEQVHDVAWLSWTYLAKSHTGEGYGSQMMNGLLGKLKDRGIRKIFIATSDYDDFGTPLYADAHRMYEDFGAEVELTLSGFHGAREAKIIYGLNNPEAPTTDAFPAAEDTGLHIQGYGHEAESDQVMGLRWKEAPEGVSGLEDALARLRKDRAKKALLAIPSDLSDANSAALESHGLSKAGQLKDYYSSGLHQVWWECSIAGK